MTKTCFVISPIGEEGSLPRKRSDQIFNYIIQPIVKKFGYTALRADKIAKPGVITTQIIELLLSSELVIADLTEKNPNVFYELGIRHTTNKYVIQLIDPSESIPFDVGHFRTIKVDYRFIDSMDRCKEEITRQIEAIEKGDAPVESPVSFTMDFTSINSDPKNQDKTNVQLLSEIQNLRSDVDLLKKSTLRIPKLEDFGQSNYFFDRNRDTFKMLFINIFRDLSKSSKDGVQESELIKALEGTGLFSKEEAEDLIKRMYSQDVIYEPRSGIYKLV